ncbi:hypothetical protein DSO57_1009773 [Entomophthora muscae]|uniref:Uncharacterized protein n=1 Tax=Entomophthora muscae TaxID=34485 RepID=A0ACC2S8S0_9FUNG|nr:hypothetical protein DSO57_1009773 [Entomophthora muscae]
MAHLGLFAPILERLASIAIKVAIDSMAATWPALYMLTPSDSLSNLPLQITCLLTISISIFCYTAIGSKMLKPSSQFGLLLVKQLTICLLYPHCISLNHAMYHFALTSPARTTLENSSRFHFKDYLTDFEQLVQQLNAFSMYSFEQLQQVADFAASSFNELSTAFEQERAATAATIAKLQIQVNKLSTPKPYVLPSPPSDDLAD